MFTFSFSDLAVLHKSFADSPIHNTLLEYFAEPKTPHNGFKYGVAIDALRQRQLLDVSLINMAPQDVNIFKKRFSLFANNNEAYRIAAMVNPPIEDIIKLSFMSPGWANLFPIKFALMHHRAEWRMSEYTGFLPFGSAVIAFFNSLNLFDPIRNSSPDFADHVNLQTTLNEMAPALGITSVDLNNYMYLEGLQMLKKQPLKTEVINLEEEDRTLSGK